MTTNVPTIKPELIFRNGVSPSMLKLWDLCKRRWFNNYIRGLKPDDSYDPRALFGIAWHRYQRDRYNPKGRLPFQESIEHFKKDFPKKLDTKDRTQDLGVRMMRAYEDTYPLETEPFRVTHVESGSYKQTTQVPLEGCKYPLNIKVDAVVKKSYGGVYVMDHKTKGRMPQEIEFVNDIQMYTYIYGIGKHLDIRVEGMIYNIASCKKTVNRDSFLRYEIEITQDQLKYHMKNFVDKANQMIELVENNYEDVESFPMADNTTACYAFFHPCPYLKMCQYNDNTAFAKELIALRERRRAEREKEKV